MAKSLISIENTWQQLLHFFQTRREEKKILVTRCRQARSTRFTRIDCRLFSIGREMEKLWTCRGNSREGEEMGREGCSWRAGSSVQIFYMGGWHTQQTRSVASVLRRFLDLSTKRGRTLLLSRNAREINSLPRIAPTFLRSFDSTTDVYRESSLKRGSIVSESQDLTSIQSNEPILLITFASIDDE